MKITPMKAIRNKCLECSSSQLKEVRECPISWCPLWRYRMGKRPPKESIEGDAAREKSLASLGVSSNSDASGEEEEDCS